ncbi:hypothetical protein [Christiangramia crocea]|uniref:Uncharacterized protein n=1 Tax=Christiangramia crocea TaxID=2904124 RepID=A0A9X1UVT3_9FLAO|nr:hypothetical protein [Gramella crocea]MCG9971006.1 hypothetical protein [Gramella crocea]
MKKSTQEIQAEGQLAEDLLAEFGNKGMNSDACIMLYGKKWSVDFTTLKLFYDINDEGETINKATVSLTNIDFNT